MSRKKGHSAPAVSAASAQAAALERFKALLDPRELTALLAELERPLPQALRVNPLKVEPAAALAGWQERYGWQLERVPYCPNGWWIKSARVPPSQTHEHRLGQYYIQDAASMLPVELFDLSGLEQPLILDMAASPGGKTTHLAARSGDRGLILANDSSASRITALRLVLQTWGAANCAVTQFPGESFGAWFPDTFDRILLDAPCSMQNLRSSESHPMRPISDKEHAGLAQRQARLLWSAFQALRPGGQLVYATCTLAPEEDEGVLDSLLKRCPGAVEVQDLSARMPIPAPGLAANGEQVYDPGVTRAARMWPHRYGTSGFFSALLVKTASVSAPTQEPPARPLAKTGLAQPTPAEAQRLTGWLEETYQFDLASVLDEYRLELWRRGTDYFALPASYLQRFSWLPFQALGLPLGQDTPDGFNLSHTWVARFEPRFAAGRVRLPAGLAPAWLRGEDLHEGLAGPFERGLTVLVDDEEGRFLGLGKVLADRLRNLMPRRIVV